MNSTADMDKWREVRVVLLCGSIIVALSLGFRHGFGLFQAPIVTEFGWQRADFAFAFAVQNIVWGATQPFSGMLADRIGAGKVLVGGALFYVAGLYFMSMPGSPEMFTLSAGVLIGLGLSGTCFPVVFGVIGRTVPESRRSFAMGITVAVGSFGQFAMVPIENYLIGTFGWSGALVALSVMCLVMIPLALPLFEKNLKESRPAGLNVGQALSQALTNRSFVLLTFGFFACGFQVVLIGVHLPSFLNDKGLASAVATTTLALVGLFNIFGAYSAGVLGSKHSRPRLLAMLYFLRAVVIAAYVWFPITATSSYLFGIAMGLLWLSTVPLTNTAVASMFGVRNMSMLSGIVFFSHQVGSFLGAWLGGRIFDQTGSYDLAWALAVGISILAALVNLPVNDVPVRQAEPGKAAT